MTYTCGLHNTVCTRLTELYEGGRVIYVISIIIIVFAYPSAGWKIVSSRCTQSERLFPGISEKVAWNSYYEHDPKSKYIVYKNII